MEGICCIRADMLNPSFKRVKSLSTVEDVATLLETYKEVLKEGVDGILYVVETPERNYLFVIGEATEGFDFYEFLNDVYTKTTVVNCVNANLLFPNRFSRGLYKSNGNALDEDEVPTGYIDESELGVNEKHYLVVKRTGERVLVEEDRVIVGRSATKCTFIIRGNTNVSRKHAIFYKDGDSYVLENCTPPNGTYVNGIRVNDEEKRIIPIGSNIRLADEELKFV